MRIQEESLCKYLIASADKLHEIKVIPCGNTMVLFTYYPLSSKLLCSINYTSNETGSDSLLREQIERIDYGKRVWRIKQMQMGKGNNRHPLLTRYENWFALIWTSLI